MVVGGRASRKPGVRHKNAAKPRQGRQSPWNYEASDFPIARVAKKTRTHGVQPYQPTLSVIGRMRPRPGTGAAWVNRSSSALPASPSADYQKQTSPPSQSSVSRIQDASDSEDNSIPKV